MLSFSILNFLFVIGPDLGPTTYILRHALLNDEANLGFTFISCLGLCFFVWHVRFLNLSVLWEIYTDNGIINIIN